MLTIQYFIYKYSKETGWSPKFYPTTLDFKRTQNCRWPRKDLIAVTDATAVPDLLPVTFLLDVQWCVGLRCCLYLMTCSHRFPSLSALQVCDALIDIDSVQLISCYSFPTICIAGVQYINCINTDSSAGSHSCLKRTFTCR